MERLTRRLNNNKIVAIKGSGCNYSAYSFDCQLSEGIKRLRTALEKLADYEDLEEQGLLVRLPCKVGDLVFIISGENICGRKVKSIKILSTAIEISTSDFVFRKESFGETVFLTRAEATKKLYEMEGQNGIKQNE